MAPGQKALNSVLLLPERKRVWERRWVVSYQGKTGWFVVVATFFDFANGMESGGAKNFKNRGMLYFFP